jgi:hypothetical protein
VALVTGVEIMLAVVAVEELGPQEAMEAQMAILVILEEMVEMGLQAV